MLALGIGIIAFMLFAAVFRSAIALGGAYALTTYVALPGAVDVFAWIAAGGFVLLQVVGVFVGLAAGIKAGGTNKRLR